MYAECVSSAIVGDDDVVLVEGDRVFSGDDVVYAYECCAETVGYDGMIRYGPVLSLVQSPCSHYTGWKFIPGVAGRMFSSQ